MKSTLQMGHLGEGIGNSKKEAERMACKKALTSS